MKTTEGHFFSFHVNYTSYINVAGNFQPAEHRHNLAQGKQKERIMYWKPAFQES